MHLSVVIPTLNESDTLPLLLEDLRTQTGVTLDIVVVDGGSTDDTGAYAAKLGARVVLAARGRGSQMNAGALAALADDLLFLHADSRIESATLLRDALAVLRRQESPRVAGHFGLRFSRTRPGHDFFYRYLEGKTRLNRPHTINGDQGLLISRKYFDELGGFDVARPFMEDQRIATRIFTTGRWVLLPGELVTSARRFESEGHAERYTLMALMTGAEVAGLHEFFDQAPGIYREQDATSRLPAAPFARLALRLMRSRGVAGWRTLYRGGCLVRANAWQLFYRRDLVRNDGRDSALQFHDRWFAPLVNNVFGNTLGAALLGLWLLKLSAAAPPKTAASAA